MIERMLSNIASTDKPTIDSVEELFQSVKIFKAQTTSYTEHYTVDFMIKHNIF